MSYKNFYYLEFIGKKNTKSRYKHESDTFLEPEPLSILRQPSNQNN